MPNDPNPHRFGQVGMHDIVILLLPHDGNNGIGISPSTDEFNSIPIRIRRGQRPDQPGRRLRREF